MSRKRGGDAPVSLFSFQDIITSVSGVMILLVLMLALQAVPPPSSAAVNPPSSFRDRTAEIASLQADLDAMRRQRDVELLRLKQNRLSLQEARLESEQAALAQRRAASEQRTETTRATLERIEREIEEQGDPNSVHFVPDSASNRKPVLVECVGNRVRCAMLGGGTAPREFAIHDSKAFQSYVRETFDRTQVYLVFLIKPSAAQKAWELARQVVSDAGYDVGLDPLEEDKSVDFEVR